ncbi:MAG: hypothetical protein ACYC4P_17970 [Thermoanaerobaculia bacterium]
MPAPGPLELALCAAAAWALLALVALAFRTRAWGRRALHAPPAGDAAAGARYAFTKGMLPQAKESVRTHLPSYAAGLVFHGGVFASFGLLAASLAGVEPGSALLRLGGAAAGAGALAGLGLLGKRAASPVLRGLSSPDDYVANLLTTAFAALAAAAAFLPAAREVWLVAGVALLLYVPVGKIRHCLLFFPARYELGRFFGRRGTFPPAAGRAA